MRALAARSRRQATTAALVVTLVTSVAGCDNSLIQADGTKLTMSIAVDSMLADGVSSTSIVLRAPGSPDGTQVVVSTTAGRLWAGAEEAGKIPASFRHDTAFVRFSTGRKPGTAHVAAILGRERLTDSLMLVPALPEVIRLSADRVTALADGKTPVGLVAVLQRGVGAVSHDVEVHFVISDATTGTPLSGLSSHTRADTMGIARLGLISAVPRMLSVTAQVGAEISEAVVVSFINP